MRRSQRFGKVMFIVGLASAVVVGTGLGCQTIRRGGGGPTYVFKGLNAEVTDYDEAAQAVPQYTFTDADVTVFVYFFGPFETGDRWFIRFIPPSGEDNAHDSDEQAVAQGSAAYFVSAGDGIELFPENGDWEIALFINDEEIGRGTITINRASLD